MAMPGLMGMGEEPEAAEAEPEALDDFASAISEAFPDIAGDPARIDALKTAIKLCLEEDTGGGYDEEEGEKKPGGLALIFGEKPKKKS